MDIKSLFLFLLSLLFNFIFWVFTTEIRFLRILGTWQAFALITMQSNARLGYLLGTKYVDSSSQYRSTHW